MLTNLQTIESKKFKHSITDCENLIVLKLSFHQPMKLLSLTGWDGVQIGCIKTSITNSS